jgi:aminomethyltransferase
LIDSAVKLDDTVAVDIRGRTEAFLVTKPPFVSPRVRER